jgi:photosystem II stability/assembly factor-like uncharacterized protein
MKNLTFFLVFLLVEFFPISIIAQWQPQSAIGLPNSVNPATAYSALDNSVCWGYSGISPKYLRTTNGGQNWTVSTITGATVGSSSIAALDANTAWVCNADAVYKTTDGGLTWDKQETAFQGFTGHPNVIHFFDADNGVCAGEPNNGYWAIYTTTNGGTNWVRVPSANIPAPIPANEVGISGVAEAKGNVFWFSTLWGALYKTTDNGMNWTVTRNILGNGDGFGFAFKDNLNGLACTFVGGKKIAKTSDGGTTWTPILPLPSGLSGLSPFFVEYAKGTSGAYVITSHSNTGGPTPAVPGSAYTLDDGTTWTYVDNLPYGPASFSSWNTGWSSGVNDVVYKWSSNVLPVELTSFTAQAQNQTVILNWVTATELNNNGFEIQRKVLESDFATVGFVKGEGTTTNQKEYSYVDRNLTDGKYFYRLKQLDFNGAYDYSNTIEVDVRLLDNFTLEQNYPNPFNPTTTIGYVLQEKSSTKLILMNAIGEEIAVLVNEEQDKGYHSAVLNGKNLSSGIYFYKLQAGNFVETKKMILLK